MKTIGGDQCGENTWKIVGDMHKDKDLQDAIDIIGEQFSCKVPCLQPPDTCNPVGRSCRCPQSWTDNRSSINPGGYTRTWKANLGYVNSAPKPRTDTMD